MEADRHHQRGMTLIELMFGIAIFAIIVGLAAPSFLNLVRENQTTSVTNDLVASLALARSEAMKRGLPVSVCASSDGEACDGSTDWAVGWIIFSDDTGDPGEVDASDEIIQVLQGNGGNFAPAGMEMTSTIEYLRFAANGLTDSNEAASEPREFTVMRTGCTGERARFLEVSRIGRLTMTRTEC